mgnify:CR=1 FL=1
MIRQLQPLELEAWLNDPSRSAPLLLDVREPREFEYCRIDGSYLLPIGQVTERHGELKPEQEVVVICHHGVRSMQVARFLEHTGFASVYNLQGGVDAWSREVDAGMPKY